MNTPRTSSRIIGLGWFIPRSRSTWDVAAWVGRVLGLPLLRGYGDAWLFWAGGTVVFEPKSDACPEARFTNPAATPSLPVFRTRNLALVRDRLLRFETELVAEVATVGGRVLVARDPFDHLVGFREAAPDSAVPADVAAGRARADETDDDGFNPGTPPMPVHLDGLDWIVRHVGDVAAMSAFYERALQAPVLAREGGAVVLDLGQGHCLELRPGGGAETTPQDRLEVPDAFILRVADFDGAKAHLERCGAVTVNDRIQFGRGALGYVADPEGHLIGYEERYDQERCPDDVVAFAEDLEANRRARTSDR